ncbi:hypothetical protein VSP10_02560 [Myroides odoratimimus]|uniref:hypothetical protein n=1 Tax=Myroides odoratimimus TaxID=76832 RepID=UPI002DB785AF|nr:hypothetical protein [Myroides odoratimimus]MEC4051663.1 hypothetical protein [Myroides odoratimimus]
MFTGFFWFSVTSIGAVLCVSHKLRTNLKDALCDTEDIPSLPYVDCRYMMWVYVANYAESRMHKKRPAKDLAGRF